MNLLTLGRFLVGDRQAISKIGRTKSALWIGLLFVISAGFAREYDAEDLLHETWYLLIPLAASIISSFILYLFVSFISLVKKKSVTSNPVQHRTSDSMFPWKRMRGDTLQAAKEPPLVQADAPEDEPKHPLGSRFWSNYLTFLTLFWMTAPLAWIYAIPVEQIFSNDQALYINLWFLGIVSLWRVLLISSVISIFFRCPKWSAFVVVMFFAGIVAFVSLWLIPVSPMMVMSGAHLPDHLGAAAQVQNLIFQVEFTGIITLPFWLISVMSVYTRCLISRFRCEGEDRVCSQGVWRLSVLSLLVWIPILPFTQPAQQNRHRVESLMREGRIAEALGEMSNHTLHDYPRYWAPPHDFNNITDPIGSLKGNYPQLHLIAHAAMELDVAPWVREYYLQTFKRNFWIMVQYDRRSLIRLDQESFEKLLIMLKTIPLNDYDAEQKDWIVNGLGKDRAEEDWKRLRLLFEIEEPTPKIF